MNTSVLRKSPLQMGSNYIQSDILINSYSLDSGPLRLDIVRLNESVFDDPGAPTMISGVLVTVQIIVANKFSFSASVLAIPVGKHSLLV